VLSSRASVLLCIGDLEGGQQVPIEDPGPLHDLTLSKFQNSAQTIVNEYDAFALARLAGLLEARGKMFRLASQSDTTFTDLQNGPAILVGLLNNTWTERLLERLRFNVDQPAPGKFVIRDRDNPLKNDWSVDYSTPYLDLTKDYALVLRMVDPKTEQTVIVAAFVRESAQNGTLGRRQQTWRATQYLGRQRLFRLEYDALARHALRNVFRSRLRQQAHSVQLQFHGSFQLHSAHISRRKDLRRSERLFHLLAFGSRGGKREHNGHSGTHGDLGRFDQAVHRNDIDFAFRRDHGKSRNTPLRGGHRWRRLEPGRHRDNPVDRRAGFRRFSPRGPASSSFDGEMPALIRNCE
jgi:hypothetical protein